MEYELIVLLCPIALHGHSCHHGLHSIQLNMYMVRCVWWCEVCVGGGRMQPAAMFIDSSLIAWNHKIDDLHHHCLLSFNPICHQRSYRECFTYGTFCHKPDLHFVIERHNDRNTMDWGPGHKFVEPSPQEWFPVHWATSGVVPCALSHLRSGSLWADARWDLHPWRSECHMDMLNEVFEFCHCFES